MKFAVVEIGGKQYKVSEGDTIKVEKFPTEYKIGDKITFDKVLLLDDEEKTQLGTPYLNNRVMAEFVAEGRGPKIRIRQFKSKSNYLKRMGHRQPYDQIKITQI